MDSVRESRSELRSDRELESTALSRGLGWFGVALGLVGLAIPKALGKAIDAVAVRRSRQGRSSKRSASFSLTILRPSAEVYAFYRKLSQLPRFMNYLTLVREVDAHYAHWVAKLPDGGTIAWDTKITADRPGELIAWRSIEGSLIKTCGQVTFTSTPDRIATQVRVEVQLEPFRNRPSKRVAAFFTTAQLARDLRRFKQVMESAPSLPSSAA